MLADKEGSIQILRSCTRVHEGRWAQCWFYTGSFSTCIICIYSKQWLQYTLHTPRLSLKVGKTEEGILVYIILDGAGFKEQNVEELEQAMTSSSNWRILDVRTPEEYQQGHVPNAVNVELSKLTKNALESMNIDKQDKLFVICASGKRSAQASVRLSKVFGYQDITNVKGGTNEWIASGRNTERWAFLQTPNETWLSTLRHVRAIAWSRKGVQYLRYHAASLSLKNFHACLW